MRMAYYSLVPGPRYERLWIRSILSLRRHNPSIPVSLFLFTGGSESLLEQAARCRVIVHHLGDYREFLARLYPRGWVLAYYPTLHKFLTPAEVSIPDAAQLLYVDCDTVFFDDVERLFETYSEADLYAREEPNSRLCHFGYDPACIDEDMLAAIAEREGARAIAPFNFGVFLLNNRAWKRFEQFRFTFLDLAWRLLSGRILSGGSYHEHHPRIPQATLGAMTAQDRSRALPYPSRNSWIFDQIAIWLALGLPPQLSLGRFSSSHVPQGAECLNLSAEGKRCIVAHYFGALESEFLSLLPPLGIAG